MKIEEADVNNQSVGKGGRPDRDGNVTLDACIMDSKGNCGAVVYMQNVTHAVSVARKVMEKTPHVMLAGSGAEKFAYEEGFKKESLLTEKSKAEWLEWKKESKPSRAIKRDVLRWSYFRATRASRIGGRSGCSRSWLRKHAAKGEVDAGRGDLFALGDLVLPVGLRSAAHDDEAAVLKHEGGFFAGVFAAEIETTFGTKAY